MKGKGFPSCSRRLISYMKHIEDTAVIHMQSCDAKSLENCLDYSPRDSCMAGVEARPMLNCFSQSVINLTLSERSSCQPCLSPSHPHLLLALPQRAREQWLVCQQALSASGQTPFCSNPPAPHCTPDKTTQGKLPYGKGYAQEK